MPILALTSAAPHWLASLPRSAHQLALALTVSSRPGPAYCIHLKLPFTARVLQNMPRPKTAPIKYLARFGQCKVSGTPILSIKQASELIKGWSDGLTSLSLSLVAAPCRIGMEQGSAHPLASGLQPENG